MPRKNVNPTCRLSDVTRSVCSLKSDEAFLRRRITWSLKLERLNCLCRKGTKRDFSTAILERKKAKNRLVVDDAVNDDNSVIALNMKTMEKLEFFRGDTVLIKVCPLQYLRSDDYEADVRRSC